VSNPSSGAMTLTPLNGEGMPKTGRNAKHLIGDTATDIDKDLRQLGTSWPAWGCWQRCPWWKIYVRTSLLQAHEFLMSIWRLN